MAAKKSKKTPAAQPAAEQKNPLQVMNAFPTYVGYKTFPDVGAINDKMLLSIYKNKAANPDGETKSNTAGTWHSKTDLLHWIDVPELGEMFTRSLLAFTTAYGVNPDDEIAFRMNAWAMVYNDRGYSTVHTHPNCHYAAVYYLDNPARDEVKTMVTGIRTCPGDIEFVDTRGAEAYVPNSFCNQTAFRVTPQAGDMLVFPAWLPHFVHPMVGTKDRICIACNATVVKHTLKKDTKNVANG